MALNMVWLAFLEFIKFKFSVYLKIIASVVFVFLDMVIIYHVLGFVLFIQPY